MRYEVAGQIENRVRRLRKRKRPSGITRLAPLPLPMLLDPSAFDFEAFGRGGHPYSFLNATSLTLIRSLAYLSCRTRWKYEELPAFCIGGKMLAFLVCTLSTASG
jgi:hypothetical protein